RERPGEGGTRRGGDGDAHRGEDGGEDRRDEVVPADGDLGDEVRELGAEARLVQPAAGGPGVGEDDAQDARERPDDGGDGGDAGGEEPGGAVDGGAAAGGPLGRAGGRLPGRGGQDEGAQRERPDRRRGRAVGEDGDGGDAPPDEHTRVEQAGGGHRAGVEQPDDQRRSGRGHHQRQAERGPGWGGRGCGGHPSRVDPRASGAGR